MKGFYTILLLVVSNTFMTLAWYGHLKFKEFKWFSTLPVIAIILISWGIAFKTETLRWNHLVGFIFLTLAVYFVFKK